MARPCSCRSSLGQLRTTTRASISELQIVSEDGSVYAVDELFPFPIEARGWSVPPLGRDGQQKIARRL